MKGNTIDDELRDRFHTMRQEEAAAAPDFDRLTITATKAAAVAKPHSPAWGSVLAAAATAAICVGAVLFWQRERRSAAVLQSWTALSQWQAPSDELLTGSSTPWGATVITATDAWLDSRDTTFETQENEERKVL